MSTGFYFTRSCEPAKSVYEAWSIATTGDTLSIKSFISLVGADDDSYNEFNFDDEFAGSTTPSSPVPLCSMAVDDVVYVIEQDSTNLSVASYDKDDGTNNWETQSTNKLNLSASQKWGYYARGMIHNQGNGSQFCINPTQVYSDKTNELFESSGTTSTTQPDGASNSRVESNTDWGYNRLSSHDFPIVLCSRVYFEENSITYDTTTGSDPYFHYFDVNFSETLEVGIGEYDYTDGSIDNVDIIYTRTLSHGTANRSIVNSNPTPPTPTLDDFINPGTWPPMFFPNSAGAGGLNAAKNFFSSYDYATSGRYIACFAYYRNDATPAFQEVVSVVIVDDNTVINESSSTVGDELGWQGCVVAHDTPTNGDYSEAILCYYDGVDSQYRVAGYTGATKDWESNLLRAATPCSVCNGWVWMRYEVDITTETAPDSRDWSNAGFTDANDACYDWMMRLDGDEWEPFRLEVSTTSWDRDSSFDHFGGDGTNANSPCTRHDLVKTVEHPYGPPLTTYGTTPP